MNHEALHASAPEGHKCADCSIDQEPCPTCYESWWKRRHPNVPYQPLIPTLLAIAGIDRPWVLERDEERLLIKIRCNLTHEEVQPLFNCFPAFWGLVLNGEQVTYSGRRNLGEDRKSGYQKGF